MFKVYSPILALLSIEVWLASGRVIDLNEFVGILGKEEDASPNCVSKTSTTYKPFLIREPYEIELPNDRQSFVVGDTCFLQNFDYRIEGNE